MEDLSGLLSQAPDLANEQFEEYYRFSGLRDFVTQGAEARNQMLENWTDRIYNAAEAEKQRAFEKLMSDTAYSRAIADLKSAGINPLYMFMGSGGQASTPGGSAASYTGSPANSGTAKNSGKVFAALIAFMAAFARLLG